MTYKDELEQVMCWLGKQKNSYFIGQAVEYAGTGMTDTLKSVPLEKKKEFFVSEDTQLGTSIGMALNGTKVISIFPRWNFLICAFSQLYNHLDKIPIYSHRQYLPSLIIRTAIGSEIPLNPQAQHKGDLTDELQPLFKNIEIIRLDNKNMIFPSYQKAYQRTDGLSTLLVEIPDKYNT